MVYVCFNQIVIIVTTKILNIVLIANTAVFLLIMKLIVFMMSMIFLKIAVYTLNTDRLRLLIGK